MSNFCQMKKRRHGTPQLQITIHCVRLDQVISRPVGGQKRSKCRKWNVVDLVASPTRGQWDCKKNADPIDTV